MADLIQSSPLYLLLLLLLFLNIIQIAKSNDGIITFKLHFFNKEI